MSLSSKNWRLNLLALLFICLFTALGLWQVLRAKEKSRLLQIYTKRAQVQPLTAKDLDHYRDLRFYRINLTGHFDNEHSFLLDNKTYHGRVGYEVYTPFYVENLTPAVLIDRGFIPLGKSRAILPAIPKISGAITLSGLINLPPHYATLSQMYEKPSTWPLRIQFIDMERMAGILNQKTLGFVINIDPKNQAALEMQEWQIVIMPPERHLGYAVQWFALALTLLILSVALNRRAAGTS